MIRLKEGAYGENRIPVTSHALDIPDRLKAVDKGYFVAFNTISQKYEIHCAWQPDTTYCCTLPFDELDARAIEYARAYSRERFAQTVAEMEAYNAKLSERREKELLDTAGYKTRMAFDYLRHTDKTDRIPEEIINA